jgi:hypothetical protein
MAYTLKLTNGNILVTLPDQQSDSLTTSLTLIGKNVNAYGTDINQNYIHLLENSANTTQPRSPLEGQLWFNTLEQRLYVRNRSEQFKPVGSPVISPTQPITLVPGDLWYDSTAQQLKILDSTFSVVTIGPSYDTTTGKNGWLTETYTDTTGIERTVVSLYVNDQILGISSNVAFTITGTTTNTAMRDIGVGITPDYTTDGPEVKWLGTATFAENLTLFDGTNVAADDLLTKNTPVSFANTLTIVYNTATLTLGSDNDIQFYIAGANTTATMKIAGQNEDFELKINSLRTDVPVLHVDSTNGYLGVFNTSPTSALDVGGDLTVHGNLNVVGNSTYTTSVDLRVNDKQIDLNYSSTPYASNDSNASGGGITLIGDTEKTIKWYNGTNAWTFDPSVDLLSPESTYKIGGVDVLTANTLAEAITSAPGLNSFGTITSATIGGLILSNSTIDSKVFNTPVYIRTRIF